MVGLTTLWLPIVVSAVVVFIASALIHMVVAYHNTDFQPLPGEERIRAAIDEAGVPEGQYAFPHPGDPKKMGSPEHVEMMKSGPAGFLWILPRKPDMPKQFIQWFVYCLVISVFVAYATGRTFPGGAEYLAVFRIAGVVAILAYAAASVPFAIWYGHTWSYTFKNVVDGVVYGLLTAGVFGWLWPA